VQQQETDLHRLNSQWINNSQYSHENLSHVNRKLKDLDVLLKENKQRLDRFEDALSDDTSGVLKAIRIPPEHLQIEADQESIQYIAGDIKQLLKHLSALETSIASINERVEGVEQKTSMERAAEPTPPQEKPEEHIKDDIIHELLDMLQENMNEKVIAPVSSTIIQHVDTTSKSVSANDRVQEKQHRETFDDLQPTSNKPTKEEPDMTHLLNRFQTLMKKEPEMHRNSEPEKTDSSGNDMMQRLIQMAQGSSVNTKDNKKSNNIATLQPNAMGRASAGNMQNILSMLGNSAGSGNSAHTNAADSGNPVSLVQTMMSLMNKQKM